ncbi:MAG: ABC transporter permease [Halapricum sp.]
MLDDRTTALAFIALIILTLTGVFGPMLAPYQYNVPQYEDGELLDNAPPSADHPLGTNSNGQDILSRLLYGARPTILAGYVGGFMILTIGATVGITAGYFGGAIESVLMRITDFFYGLPLIPFAIVLTAFMGVGYWQSIFVIGAVIWRGTARTLRSQVLQIKERPFIKSAEAVGSSRTRIIIKHVLPNVATMAVLFFALGVGRTIMYQASLSFLGVASPFIPSWGVMIRNAYQTGALLSYWYWSLPPGILISATVVATYLFGRGYEEVSQQSMDEDAV